MFLPHPLVKLSIVGSLRDRKVACSASDLQGLNFESCVWRAVSSHSPHHPQEVLLAQICLYVHKGGLKPHSFNLILLLFVFVRQSSYRAGDKIAVWISWERSINRGPVQNLCVPVKQLPTSSWLRGAGPGGECLKIWQTLESGRVWGRGAAPWSAHCEAWHVILPSYSYWRCQPGIRGRGYGLVIQIGLA